MKTLKKGLLYLADRIFSAIILAIALAFVLTELVRRGYLEIR